MAVINSYLLIILNVHGLNSPVKRYGIAKWVKKQGPTLSSYK